LKSFKLLVYFNVLILEEMDEELINTEVRKLYEPRYGKSLTDDEVEEIRTNLRSFAEGITEIARGLHGNNGLECTEHPCSNTEP